MWSHSRWRNGQILVDRGCENAMLELGWDELQWLVRPQICHLTLHEAIQG